MLVMGFTGEKAYKFKVEFIKAFNEMEKRLKSRSFNDLSLIDELKSSNLIKDEYKRQT
ncbi:Rha family transcriptional regulator [Campylobacter felis]|nr:Rha family transcriptional regulator [Campylobacter felis]